MQVRWRWMLCFLWAIFAPATVWAQTPPVPGAPGPNPAVDHARERFQAGVRAYEEGRYRDAIDLLLEADRSMHSPAFAYNIGLAYEAMQDQASALRWFRAYLREAPDTEDRAAVEKRIGALEEALQKRGIQQATVLSSPEGATVTFDGKPLGVTPWTGELVPGRHRLELTLRGHERIERYIEVLAHRAQDYSFQLQVATAQPPSTVPAAPPSEAPVTTESKLSRVSPWTWTALTASTLVLGGALVFEISRAKAEDDARGAPQVDYQDKLDTAESRQTTARVLAAVGGALLVTSGVLLAVDLTRSRKAEVSLHCGGSGCFVAGRGAF
jgi:tetratricopeptide (TPR) repeat protein